MTPTQTRRRLKAMGVTNVIAFQTLDSLGAVHQAAITSASRARDAAVFLDPIVGPVTPGDFGHFERIRAYKAIVEGSLNPDRALFSIVPLPTRLNGPRELLWHLLVRRNYGANSAIVTQDQLVPEPLAEEIGVTQIPFCGVDPPLIARNLSLRHDQGFCLWFTGLSGAGKSTTAEIIAMFLQERGRRVTLLDGDLVRTHLSKGLGFTRDDRDANIRRIGFVAAEIVKHGGAVICAAVSPYRTTRDEVRALVGNDRFIEVFVDTPLEECERRDVKGMYAKARKGQMPGFTGIDDPYEPPLDPELTLQTIATSPESNAGHILDLLIERRWIPES
jgi:sulfate adenylyltransferase